MICIQVCLVLMASCTMLASADLASYHYGYNDPSVVELKAPASGCDDSPSSGYVVTGSTPTPIMRTAVEIEPARIISASPSPTLSSVSEFVSVTTPAPIMRSAIDIEPARIINAAPMNLEARIETSPLLDTFRPALATYDSIGKSSTIISEVKEANPVISTQYSISAPQVESKITTVHSSPIISPLSTRMLPSMSSSYSYAPQTYASSYLNANTAPQYYSSAAAYGPQYYSSAAAYAPRYYSSAAAYAPRYYSSAAAYAPQYYSSAAAYAPRYYSSAAAYAPQYYSSAAAYSPRYYSSAAAYTPQYYSSATAYSPQYYSSAATYSPQYYSSSAAFAHQYSAAPNYYSSVSIAADEPCDKK